MPRIAIIGRQNVGKSSLFNALLGKRRSITYDQPGVTRDLVSARTDWGDGDWILTDFPGFEDIKKVQNDQLEKESIIRAMAQMDNFQLILWVVSVKGLEKVEYDLAETLRRSGKKIWLVVNFVDDPSVEAQASDFHKLGFSDLFFVSALNKRNVGQLRESIRKYFSAFKTEKPETESLRLALVGKPNAGKSTLFNSFLQQERSMTSNIPGTTRDTIEEDLHRLQHSFTLSDTAGLKKNTANQDSVDFFSQKRTEKAIDEADVVLYVIDPFEGFDRQNKSLISLLEKKGKPLILVVNKSDLISREQRDALEDSLKEAQKKYWKFPYYFISAPEGKKNQDILKKAMALKKASEERLSVNRLNELLLTMKRNPALEGNSIKLKYITQAEKNLRLVIFANTNQVPENALRFVRNKLKEELGWQEMPVQILFRASKKKEPAH